MEYFFTVDSSFNIEKTMECGQCFHYEKLRDNKYRVYGLNTICEIEQENNDICINTNDIEYWKMYFALDTDYSKIIEYLRDFCEKNNDEFGLRAIEKGKGIKILAQPFFETCCSFILSQQNNIPRIRKMVFGLSEKYSRNQVCFNGCWFNCFPNYKDFDFVTLEELKALGLGYRAEYLKEFADSWESISDKVKFDYKTDFELFKSCKGIGDKVSNCICLYGYNEFDAFPIDVWMKKIIKEEYTDKGRELKIPEKYAGILQQFMFYTKRQESGK
jgi:N-glycosylase/DNA lyase